VQQHPDQPADGDPVTSSELNQTREEVLEYWTSERMAKAKPRELRLPEPGTRPENQDDKPAQG
jgi:hypothetical protein